MTRRRSSFSGPGVDRDAAFGVHHRDLAYLGLEVSRDERAERLFRGQGQDSSRQETGG